MSAHVLAAAGFDALATTSGGFARALPMRMAYKPQGQRSLLLPRASCGPRTHPRLPISKRATARHPGAVTKSVAEMIWACAVGVKLEDRTPHRERRSVTDPDHWIACAASSFAQDHEMPAGRFDFGGQA